MAAATALRAVPKAQARLDAQVMRERRALERALTPRFERALRSYYLGLLGRMRWPVEERQHKWHSTLGRPIQLKAEPAFNLSYDELLNLKAEQDRLRKLVGTYYDQVYYSVGSNSTPKQVRAAVQIQAEFNTPQVFSRSTLADIANAVTAISETDRLFINSKIRQGLAQQLSPAEIAKELRSTFPEFSKARAKMIARTETAIAYNRASLDQYEGITQDRVRVLDAVDCGWTSHDDSELANGRIVTFQDARTHVVAHPNCVRAFAPVVHSFDKTPDLTQPGELTRPPKTPKGSAPQTAAPAYDDRYDDPLFDELEEPLYEGTADRLAFAQSWGGLNYTDRWGSLVGRDTLAAIQDYVGAGYTAFNSYLRKVFEGNAYVKQAVGLLDKIFERPDMTRLPRAAYVWRGTGWSAFGADVKTAAQAARYGGSEDIQAFDQLVQGLVGRTFSEPGYMSTALGEPFPKPAVMRILAPKGQRALWIGSGEMEVLFPRGQKFVVDRVRKKGRYEFDAYYVDVRLVD